MPLKEHIKGSLALLRVADFGCMGGDRQRLDRRRVMKVSPDNERNSVILLDVREFLALPRDNEVDENVFIGVADQRALRPAVRANRRDRHDPILIEDADGFVFHGSSFHLCFLAPAPASITVTGAATAPL